MQTVYEIIQDDMPLDCPLFTDLGRARHEMDLIIQDMLQAARQHYHDAYVMPLRSENPYVEGDMQCVMAANSMLEYTCIGVYRRMINTASLGDSHS